MTIISYLQDFIPCRNTYNLQEPISYYYVIHYFWSLSTQAHHVLNTTGGRRRCRTRTSGQCCARACPQNPILRRRPCQCRPPSCCRPQRQPSRRFRVARPHHCRRTPFRHASLLRHVPQLIAALLVLLVLRLVSCGSASLYLVCMQRLSRFLLHERASSQL